MLAVSGRGAGRAPSHALHLDRCLRQGVQNGGEVFGFLVGALPEAVAAAEVVQRAVLVQHVLQLVRHLDLALVLAVLQERPKLLQAVQVAILIVAQREVLEVVENVCPELLLQSVAVEPEKALEAIAVVSGGVLHGKHLHLIVHLATEVGAQEVRPEAVERVHFLGLADAHLLPLIQALGMELVIFVLHKAIFLQQFMRGVLEIRELLLVAAAHEVQGRLRGRERRGVQRRGAQDPAHARAGLLGPPLLALLAVLGFGGVQARGRVAVGCVVAWPAGVAGHRRAGRRAAAVQVLHRGDL
mmetsp:Transcript_13414/g.34213  ORF Transcript_13414/g.34213 Transcript_13414/m.34213 type:complete len:299 (+) Transcript_13414:546-1442(+)